MNLDADMQKLGLWKGLCFHMNAFQIHGHSITADNIGALMPVSNLEATPATRLDEMYLEQHLFNDKLAIKIGQLAADTEFILSESYPYFLNGTWGWPSIAASLTSHSSAPREAHLSPPAEGERKCSLCLQ